MLRSSTVTMRGQQAGRAHALAPRPARRAAVQCSSHRAGSAAAAAAASFLLLTPGAAFANKDRIAEFSASGLIFKDTVEVSALEDPEIEGITLFFSDFKRSLTDKLSKDFFSEPSQASLTCAVTGPVKIKDLKRIEGSEGREVFSEAKGINIFTNKTLRVRRIYDADRGTVLYVSYSTRLSGASSDGGVSSGRYRTSICALPLTSYTAPSPATLSAAAAAAAPVADAPAASP